MTSLHRDVDLPTIQAAYRKMLDGDADEPPFFQTFYAGADGEAVAVERHGARVTSP